MRLPPGRRNLDRGISAAFAQMQFANLPALASRNVFDGDIIAALALHADSGRIT